MELYDYSKNKILLSLPQQKKKAGEEGKRALFTALKQSYDKTKSLLVKVEDIERKVEDKFEANNKAIVATSGGGRGGKFGLDTSNSSPIIKTPNSSRQLIYSPREVVLSPSPLAIERRQQVGIDSVKQNDISDKVYAAIQLRSSKGAQVRTKTFTKKVDVFSPSKKRTSGWRERYGGSPSTGLIEGAGSAHFTSPINNSGLVVKDEPKVDQRATVRGFGGRVSRKTIDAKSFANDSMKALFNISKEEVDENEKKKLEAERKKEEIIEIQKREEAKKKEVAAKKINTNPEAKANKGTFSFGQGAQAAEKGAEKKDNLKPSSEKKEGGAFSFGGGFGGALKKDDEKVKKPESIKADAKSGFGGGFGAAKNDEGNKSAGFGGFGTTKDDTATKPKASSGSFGIASSPAPAKSGFGAPTTTGSTNLFGSDTSSSGGSNPFNSSKPASATPFGGGSSGALDYTKLLTEFYQKHNASKVSEVTTTLAKYKGREKELFVKLSTKYKVANPLDGVVGGMGGGGGQQSTPFGTQKSTGQPSPFGTKTPFNSGGGAGASPFGTKTPFGNTGAGAASPFGKSAAAPSPSPFGNSGSVASPFGNSAAATNSPFGNAAAAPSPSPFGNAAAPAPSPFGGSQQSNQSPFGGASSSQQSTPFGGNSGSTTTFGGGANTSGGFGAQASLGGGGDYRSMVTKFYQQYNPTKVSDVDKVLMKYRGQEQKMLANLSKKYNLPPNYWNQVGGGGGGL